MVKAIRVLIADDHTLFRSSLRCLLELQPVIEVIGEAKDGVDVVQKASQLRPDVILMDLSMPVLNGFEATREIRERLPDCRVLVLTMYTDKEYVLRSLETGASGYISKNATPEEIVSAIQAVHREEFSLPFFAGKFVVREYLKQLETRKGTPRLTPKEREILRLIVKGYSGKEIASTLFISPKTVANHKFHIMKKLDIHNAAGLAVYAIKEGIGWGEDLLNP